MIHCVLDSWLPETKTQCSWRSGPKRLASSSRSWCRDASTITVFILEADGEGDRILSASKITRVKRRILLGLSVTNRKWIETLSHCQPTPSPRMIRKYTVNLHSRIILRDRDGEEERVPEKRAFPCVWRMLSSHRLSWKLILESLSYDMRLLFLGGMSSVLWASERIMKENSCPIPS